LKGASSVRSRLTLSDILESPTKVLEAVLECAGSPPDGSAASNAVWEGVPLARFWNKLELRATLDAVLLEERIPGG